MKLKRSNAIVVVTVVVLCFGFMLSTTQRSSTFSFDNINLVFPEFRGSDGNTALAVASSGKMFGGVPFGGEKEVPIPLYRHNLSYCVYPGSAPFVPPILDTDAIFRKRLQCWCSDRERPFHRNCLMRAKDAVIQRLVEQYRSVVINGKPTVVQVGSIRSARVTELVVYGAPVPFYLRVDTDQQLSTEVFIRGKTESSIPDSDEIAIFSHAPYLFVSSGIFQENFYHSVMGPHGALQIVQTRDAINGFYEAMNTRLRSGKQEEEDDSAPTPLLTSQVIFRDSSRLPASCGKARYHTPLPQTYLAREILLGTSLRHPTARNNFAKNVSASDGDQDDAGEASSSETNPHAPTSTASPATKAPSKSTWLSARQEDALTYFANRLGFCQTVLPRPSQTIVSDLWVHLIYGHLGTQWITRKEPVPESALPSVQVLEEHATVCPLREDELLVAQWGHGRLEQCLNEGRPFLEKRPNPVPCFKRGKGGPGKEICPLVIGRSLSKTAERIRGLAHNIEFAILNALLLRNNSTKSTSEVQKPSTINTKDTNTSLWHWNEEDQKESCKIGLKAVDLDPGEAASALDRLNYFSGMAPCKTSTDRRPFLYQKIKFVNSSWSKRHNFSSIRRASFDGLTIPMQHAHIQSANLFIFEEGAPATWSFFAKEGSTFIISFNSNYERWMRYFEQMQSRSRRVANRRLPEIPKDNPNYQKWLSYLEYITIAFAHGPRGAVKKSKYQPQLPNARLELADLNPSSEYFSMQPYITGKVRVIFLIFQHGRLPSFARLREAFDRPWRAETLFVGCECNTTRVVALHDIWPRCADPSPYPTLYDVNKGNGGNEETQEQPDPPIADPGGRDADVGDSV